MAYSDFKRFSDSLKKLQLKLQERRGLFSACPEIQPSDLLLQVLQRGIDLATEIGTEKARSEMIVSPLLLELKTRLPEISLFSGVELVVDPAAGLAGVCDYLLSRNPVQTIVTAPVVAVVEAKREAIHEGLGQCAAEMVASQRFNQQECNDVAVVHGAVTTGTLWTFMSLSGSLLTLDPREYLIAQPGKLLGILASMVQGTAPPP